MKKLIIILVILITGCTININCKCDKDNGNGQYWIEDTPAPLRSPQGTCKPDDGNCVELNNGSMLILIYRNEVSE